MVSEEVSIIMLILVSRNSNFDDHKTCSPIKEIGMDYSSSIHKDKIQAYKAISIYILFI